MATKKNTTTATKKTTRTRAKAAPKRTDLEITIEDLTQDGLLEGRDFFQHEYTHGYIDLRFVTNRPPIEFRPDGSRIDRDPYGREIKDG